MAEQQASYITKSQSTIPIVIALTVNYQSHWLLRASDINVYNVVSFYLSLLIVTYNNRMN